MYLQPPLKSPGEGAAAGWTPLSLWERMHQARALLIGAGVLAFLGLAMAAVGTLDVRVAGTTLGSGPVLVSPLIPWGIVLVGLGAMLGFFGAALKGPSREWGEVVSPAEGLVEAPVAPGHRYACPECGGDVYTSQTICPACGHALPGVQTP